MEFARKPAVNPFTHVCEMPVINSRMLVIVEQLGGITMHDLWIRFLAFCALTFLSTVMLALPYQTSGLAETPSRLMGLRLSMLE